MQKVWYHGTTLDKAVLIMKKGFKRETWFARHMEDALEFGGPCIFAVNVTFAKTPMKWQACCSNPIPPTAIRKRLLVTTGTKRAGDPPKGR